MLQFFEAIEEYTETQFEKELPTVIVQILDIVRSGTPSEIKGIAELLLTIENPIHYVKIVENLFISNHQLYIRLVNEGSKEIAKRRKELTD